MTDSSYGPPLDLTPERAQGFFERLKQRFLDELEGRPGDFDNPDVEEVLNGDPRLLDELLDSYMPPETSIGRGHQYAPPESGDSQYGRSDRSTLGGSQYSQPKNHDLKQRLRQLEQIIEQLKRSENEEPTRY